MNNLFFNNVIVIFCIFFGNSTYSLKAQIDTTKGVGEINLDKGVVSIIGMGGSSTNRILSINISLQNDNHIYGLRYTFDTDEELVINISNYSRPYEKSSEFGIYYGWQRRWSKKFYGTIGGGISYVYGVKRGNYLYTKKTFFSDVNYYEQKQFKSLGFITDARINFLLYKYINFSVNGVANLNYYRSFYGILLGIGFYIPY